MFRSPSLIVPGVLLSVAVLVGACGTAPSPSPTGPADRFLATMTAPDVNLAAALAGSYALADGATYPVWGALAAVGDDRRTLTTMESPLGIEAWEQVVHAGEASTRRGADLWDDPIPAGEAPADLIGALEAVEAMEDLGTETIDGQTLRHVRATDLALGPDAFGIEGETTTPSATLDAWLADDGAPVAMRLTSGPLTLEFDPIRIGGAAPIAARPELAVLQSPALRYALVHPASAEVSERGTAGHLIGLDGAYAITFCVAGSMELPNWVTEGTVLYNGLWGAKPESVEPLVVKAGAGPVPATLSTWHGTAEGREAYILDLAVVADGIACDVQWFSPPGNEAADRARFEQLVAGFRLGG